MKNANGFGSVYKLSGKRRKPWVASKTFGWELNEKTGKVKQIQKPIGYFETKEKAITALVNFNENPYDIKANSITFEEVYNKWSDEYFSTISPSSYRSIKSAYSYCSSLHKMRMRDIRVMHLEGAIDTANVGLPTKQRMKSMFNLMYRYAMKHEIVDKDYAALCKSVSRGEPTIERIPFSDAEIKTLRENIEFPFVDMVLIGIYSGWRPQELAKLQLSDIDLENGTFKGGLKTNAGKNRIVPIHSLIYDLVKQNYEKAVSLGSEYLFNDENSRDMLYLTYDKYRRRFEKIVKYFNWQHTPHDTRHTFITKAKQYNLDDNVLKLIVGHSINDITEKVYTHRKIDELRREIEKIKE